MLPKTVAVPAPTRSESPATQAGALTFVHGCLRGHYALVIVLGLLFGAAGALAGWRLARPLYRSEALLQIQYLPLRADPSVTIVTTPFDVFMQSQQTLITSHRVVDRALQDPGWRAAGGLFGPKSASAFVSHLEVITRPNQEYMRITYTDPSPAAAAAAVRAVVSAYVDMYNFDEEQRKQRLLKVWSDQIQATTAAMDKARRTIDQAVAEFGSASLVPMQDAGAHHDLAVERISQLEAQLQELQAGASVPPGSAPAGRGAVTGERTAAVADEDLTADEISAVNTTMRSYLDEEHRLEDQLTSLRSRGYLESYREIMATKTALEKARSRVEEYEKQYNAAHNIVRDAGGGIRAVPVRKEADLRVQEEAIMSLRNEALKQMIRLEKARNQVDWAESEMRRNRDTLDHLNRMKSALEDQEQMGGRLAVINPGEVPLAPALDSRVKFAGSGALGGTSLPMGLFVLYGLLRRTYRYSNDAAQALEAKLPLLGILPTLRNSPRARRRDIEQAAGAAHHIHQIRVLLQQGEQPRAGGSSYLISSASAGEGKTSLTMALALSFAASGYRTLVIDADLIGRQITRGLGALDERGLQEALQAGSIRGHLRQTAFGLAVLPVGQAQRRDANTLSARQLQELLVEAREYFEAVLIDSGPVLGSIESSVLAQQADSVVLVVARGQERGKVDKAVRRLNALGAHVRGVVFNRADTRDFLEASYGSSSRSPSVRLGEADSVPQRHCRFGPLVDAVLDSLPRVLPQLSAAGEN